MPLNRQGCSINVRFWNGLTAYYPSFLHNFLLRKCIFVFGTLMHEWFVARKRCHSWRGLFGRTKRRGVRTNPLWRFTRNLSMPPAMSHHCSSHCRLLFVPPIIVDVFHTYSGFPSGAFFADPAATANTFCASWWVRVMRLDAQRSLD